MGLWYRFSVLDLPAGDAAAPAPEALIVPAEPAETAEPMVAEDDAALGCPEDEPGREDRCLLWKGSVNEMLRLESWR